ncbi:hypothetical protein B0H13DRAFT_2005647 [Mycena leptocephala]|nr:hypothetical protein B0H13DRAFT_2005647 [Mycena leptocephala]
MPLPRPPSTVSGPRHRTSSSGGHKMSSSLSSGVGSMSPPPLPSSGVHHISSASLSSGVRSTSLPRLPGGVHIPAREQCLRNKNLLARILDHISSETDCHNLKAQRRAFLCIALTCKVLCKSAIKFLWRRLDNLLPLLRLLSSFTTRNGRYGLFGSADSYEWKAFDRYAAYVQEIVYKDIPDAIRIDPSVYLHLSLRNSPLLPGLRRFVCPTSVRPSPSEILLYLQSPLNAMELGTYEPGTLFSTDTGKMAATRETIVSSLSAKPNQLSHLILHLTSLELRAMYGVMDAKILARIGSLPHLRSFTADSGCLTGLNLSNTHARLARSSNSSQTEQVSSRGGLFAHLTHLELELHPSLPYSSISLTKLRSLILGVRPKSKVARVVTSKNGSATHPKVEGDALHTILSRWAKTLHRFHLEVDDSITAVSNLLRRLPALRALRLSGVLHVPDDADICAAFAGLPKLASLSLRCRARLPSHPAESHSNTTPHPPIRHPLDIAIAIPSSPSSPPSFSSSSGLPAFSSTPTIAHGLRTLRVHSHPSESGPSPIGNLVPFARHLDRLFPRLDTVRYEDALPMVGEEGQWRAGKQRNWGDVGAGSGAGVCVSGCEASGMNILWATAGLSKGFNVELHRVKE